MVAAFFVRVLRFCEWRGSGDLQGGATFDSLAGTASHENRHASAMKGHLIR
jgi:hypothetical protein